MVLIGPVVNVNVFLLNFCIELLAKLANLYDNTIEP